MVSMAFTNQRRSLQGRNTSYVAKRALDLSTARLSWPWTNQGGVEKNLHQHATATKAFFFCGCWCKFSSTPPYKSMHPRPARKTSKGRCYRQWFLHPVGSTADKNKLCSQPSDWPVDINCEQLLFAWDQSEELFPKLRTPTALIVQVKNKTQNWAIH